MFGRNSHDHLDVLRARAKSFIKVNASRVVGPTVVIS
jgi:hypothetical protein